MSRWIIAYRIATVALLAVIALQLGGWEWISLKAHQVSYSIRHIGKEPEGPAPPAPGAPQGGLDAMFQEGTDMALRDRLQRPPASQPGR